MYTYIMYYNSQICYISSALRSDFPLSCRGLRGSPIDTTTTTTNDNNNNAHNNDTSNSSIIL